MTPLRPYAAGRPGVGVAMVLAAGTLFAVNGTAAKLILQSGLDAQQLTLLRAVGAAAGLLVVAAALPSARLRLSAREVPMLIAYGLTGFFLVPMLYFVAIARIPVSIGLLFEFTAPLFVAVWARFGQGQRVRPRLWVGLGLCLLGLAGVANIGGDLRLDVIGVAAALTCAVLLAAYYVLGAHSVRNRDAVSLTGWAFTVSALAGLAYRLVVGVGDWSALGGTAKGLPVWLLAAYLVIFGSIVPYCLVAAAMRHLPATSVGIIGMIEPVVAGAFAWVTLGEKLTPAQLAGGAVLLAGVGLAETARIAKPVPEQVRESVHA
ncbi:EamA family transporter [Hamadaea tsunoensis]|uniref:EamA family transporter n=1 Tax=Hamadaea tsunoensis TaxID=53368 RepID=UPI000480B093|nr:EamA family transporter [Hamadaea tsunoensis]